jgi:hypothetical protein
MPLTCCDDVIFWLLTRIMMGGRSDDNGGDWVSDNVALVSDNPSSAVGETDDGIFDVNEGRCVVPIGFCVAADVLVDVT